MGKDPVVYEQGKEMGVMAKTLDNNEKHLAKLIEIAGHNATANKEIAKGLERQNDYFRNDFQEQMTKAVNCRDKCNMKPLEVEMEATKKAAEKAADGVQKIPMQLYFFIGTSLCIIGALVGLLVKVIYFA